MQKQAPTFFRLATMALFALSCFGLLLYLWLSFGGPIPLRPEGWRFQAKLDEAALLVEEADVRIAGLNVGKVKDKRFARQGGVIVELEIDEKFAPLPADTRAILRQKTILGQIYVELTPGTKAGPKLDEGDTLPVAQVQEATEIDELIRTFDKPTRRAWQGWIREIGTIIDGNGEDLNNVYGNLPAFVGSGEDLLSLLDEQEPVLQRLIRNSGVAFAALTERQGQLRELITNANDFFGALASRNDALAETIRVFPTFLDESRLTVDRLQRFASDTRPLVRALAPVADQLQPTLRDLGLLAPDLERLFRKTDPLIRESARTLPQLTRVLRGLEPLLVSAHIWLPQFNPILSFLNFEQQQVADFISNGAASLNGTLPGIRGEGPRHYLRQYSITNSRSLGIATTRPEYDRGNSYPGPNYQKRSRLFGMTEAFDCKATGRPGDGTKPEATNGSPPCFVQPKSLYDGKQFPRLGEGDAPLRPPPANNDSSAGAAPAAP